MAETLHKILTKYVSFRLLLESSQEEKDETVRALELKIEKEIIEEKSNELTLQQTKIMQREREKFNEQRLQDSIDRAKDVFYGAGIIGLLIGLLVNQITDLISAGKSLFPQLSNWLTVIAISVLVFGCWKAFDYIYMSKVVKIVQKYMKKDEEQ